jgi:hypothetical protein
MGRRRKTASVTMAKPDMVTVIISVVSGSEPGGAAGIGTNELDRVGEVA